MIFLFIGLICLFAARRISRRDKTGCVSAMIGLAGVVFLIIGAGDVVFFSGSSSSNVDTYQYSHPYYEDGYHDAHTDPRARDFGKQLNPQTKN